MKLLRAAFVLLALVLGLVSTSEASSIPDGTQVAIRAGFPGRMGPIAQVAGFSNPETATLIAAMTNAPTAARAAQIDQLISDFKAGGVWSAKRAIYVLAAADSQAASLNWKSPGTNTITVLTGTPTFTANSGYMFNNANALDTNFNPTTRGIQKDSESLSIYILNNVAANTYAIGTSGTAIQPQRSTGNNVSGLSQNATTTTGASGAFTTSVGLTAFNRGASTGFVAYKNGVAIETLTRASVGVDNNDLFIGGKNNGAGTLGGSAGNHLVAYAAMGDAMDAPTNLAEFNAISNYLTAVGAQ